MDIGAALTDMWRSVLLFVPKALAFLAILLVGYLVARVVRKLVDRVLARVNFDRAVRRSGIGRRLADSRYDAGDVLSRLAYYAILLFALQLAFGVWGPNPISDLIAAVVGWLPRAFVAIVIVVVATAIASALRDLIGGALGGLTYGRVIATVVWVFVVGLGVIAALNQVGIATTVTTPVLVAVLATIAGILIVGVGGGLVRPMQGRWERWLDRLAAESAVVRERARAYQAEKEEAARRHAEEEAARRRAEEEAARRRAEEEAAARAEAVRAEAARAAAARAAAERAAAERAEAEREEAERAAAARREAELAAATDRADTAPLDSDADRTQVIPSADAESTQVIPRPDGDAVPPRTDDDVHIVPGMGQDEPATPPATPRRRPGTGRSGARRGKGKTAAADPAPTRLMPAVDGADGVVYRSGRVPAAEPEADPAEPTQVIRPREGRED